MIKKIAESILVGLEKFENNTASFQMPLSDYRKSQIEIILNHLREFASFHYKRGRTDEVVWELNNKDQKNGFK